MAVTITRTPWIDDDGTGTTGTVINNAVKTGLYNEIDAALAKVAQLAGGNTFTGNQALATLTVSGLVQVQTSKFGVMGTGEVLINTPANAGNAQVMLVADGNAHTGIAIQNSYTGNFMNYIAFFNSAMATTGVISQAGVTSVNYGTASDRRLKDDAGRATDLAALRAVVVHDFAWTADGRTDRGVFAQEAHAVFPRAVTVGTDETTADGSLARPWMTDYSKFVPDLIVGWQQHDADLADLRAAVATLAAEKGF